MRLLRALDAAGTLYAPERLHAVRIAAKKLRYGLELRATPRGLPVGSFAAALKRVQDVLGRLHDLAGARRPGARDGGRIATSRAAGSDGDR